MTPSRSYIRLRASRTLQCMTVIKNGTPSWEWAEKSVADFTIDYNECQALIEDESDESADTTGARGTRDVNVGNLRAKGRLALALFKVKYRNNPAKLAYFKRLVMSSETVSGTLDEALATESAWQKADPAYVLDDGTTWAQFKALRELCLANAESVSKEVTEEFGATGAVSVELQAIYKLCVAWYAVATALYGEETAHGMMIRGLIPTQPSSGGTLPGEVSLTIEGGIGQATLTFSAENAVGFLIKRRMQGELDFGVVAAGVPGPSYVDDSLPIGTYEYVVAAQNLQGDGPDSEVVAVEVT
jgi:hypothetical protein